MPIETALRKLRYDRYNKVVFKMFPGAYLVGGFIRDAIIGRPSIDRDYIVDFPPVEVVNLMKNKFEGAVVLFHDRRTARFVLGNRDTLDFTELKGSLEEDLFQRDFTMNALAYTFKAGIIDPWKGIKDIAKRTIRTLGRENLEQDPLRCLRAYRFRSEIGWKIEKNTKNYFHFTKDKLRMMTVPERITFEFFKLLGGKYALIALRDLLKDGILSEIIHCDINELEKNMYKLLEIERFIKKLPYKIQKTLSNQISQELRNRELIFLERLLYGIEIETVRMKFSRSIRERLRKAHIFLKEGKNVVRDMSALYSYFVESREMVYDLVCLTGRVQLVQSAEKFIRIQKNKIISTEEIMEITSAKGKQVGKILYELGKERFLNRVRTKREARQFVKQAVRETASCNNLT